MDDKYDTTHREHANTGAKGSLDGVATGSESKEHILVSDADSRRICDKTDLHLLTVLVWVYFLQILDKSIVGYSTVFGLNENAGLVGDQYSIIGSIGYYAQLVAQPLGAYLLVKCQIKWLMPIIVTCWGISLCGMAGSKNFTALAATRFLLGWFEAMCLSMFSLITANWYRRSEQPMRVAAWYASNGYGTIFGSALVYGLGHIKSSALYSYQIIFLLTGLVTVVTGPILYWLVDNGVGTARFLSPEDRLKGVERLRANNTGVEAQAAFKWSQAIELACEPKTYLFLGMSLCANMGASVFSVFGPLILRGLAGFTSFTTTLLNIPFGALQVVVIYAASYAAYRFKTKSIVFFLFMLPVVIGTVLMYTLERVPKNKGPLLLGYYCLAFVFSANPLIVSWMAANTAGQSKKASLYSAFNGASAIGNIVAPYLFKAADAPGYLPGVKATLAFFCVLEGLIVTQVVVMFYLNNGKETQRVRNGKPAKLRDLSMEAKFDNSDQAHTKLSESALLDQTDRENDEFVYLY